MYERNNARVWVWGVFQFTFWCREDFCYGLGVGSVSVYILVYERNYVMVWVWGVFQATYWCMGAFMLELEVPIPLLPL